MSNALHPDRRLRIKLDLSAAASSAQASMPAEIVSEEKYFTFGPKTSPRQYRYHVQKKRRDKRSGNLNGPYYWMSWYHDGKRFRPKRKSLAALRAHAEEIDVSIQNGQVAMACFTEDHRASYRRCVELASKVNVPVELLVSEAVEARLKAAESTHVRKTVPEVATAFLAQKDKELKRKKWYRSLSKMVNRFAEYFTGNIDELRAHDLNAWLRALPGGPDYRRHHREAVSGLFGYAKSANYLPREWDELKLVDNPKSDPVMIKTWTADQVSGLLVHTQESMIPFTVLQVFAGIRHEEINPEEFDLAKTPLDWSDLDWERKQIHVAAETAKMGENRIIPMEENLIAWLKPRAKASGPVCTVRNTSNALSRAKHRAGLPAGRNQSRNVLRKTWISARLAIVKNIGQVAEEAGNSVAKVKSNYRRPMSEAAAKRIFSIHPTSADILQLPLKGMAQ
jgi:integrase